MVQFKDSKLAESRKRALSYNRMPDKSSVLDNDEQQLLSVIYAPNQSGFPECSMSSLLSSRLRPEVAEYVQGLMYKSSPNGTPDVDAALDTIIPYNVQYGDEIRPYLDTLRGYIQNVRDSKFKKSDENE